MGTSASYGGSAGQGWTNARHAARKLGALATRANARRAAAAAAAALVGWEDLPLTQEEQPTPTPAKPGPGQLPPRTPAVPPDALRLPALPPLSTGGRSGARGGGGRAGGGGAARGTTRIRGGSSRSPRRAGAAAARIAAAGYAARAGDAAALAVLGIDIAALAGRTPRHQCNVILNAILDLPRTLQEQELRAACSTTLIQLLNEEAGLAPRDVVRIFVSNYLIEIMAVEQSATMRENGDGVAAERILRQTVDAVVARVVSGLGTQIASADLERVIAETLERTRRIMETG